MDYSLKAIFGMDGTGFRADLKQTMAEARSAVNSWANIVSGAAVAAVAALAKGAIDLAGHLSDTSQNLGINVVSLQALEAQHKRNGVSQEELTKALEKTRAAGIAAFNGDVQQQQALAKLGLTAGQFISLPLDKQYAAIGRGINAASDKQAAYNAVTTLFGEKIGPKLMASLKELGEDGLPKVTAEAQKAGQIMSAETIVALDRAGDAIDDFKKKATVAIGNIIVNFRSKEGLELLLFQFLKVVGVFGAKILDAVVEAGGFVKALIGGAFSWVVETFRNGILDAAITAAGALNKILPKKFEIDVGGLEKLKSAGADLGNHLVEAIARAKPSTFAKDVGDFWDKTIGDQQNVVNQLNNVDLGKDAGKLTNAGKDIQNSGIKAATALADAGKTAAAELTKAAAVVGGAINRKGKTEDQLSDVQLAALKQNLNNSLFKQQQQDQTVLGAAFGPEGYKSPQAYLLEQELAKVKAEEQLRNNFKRDVGSFGIGYAEQNYAASDFERLKNLQGLTSAAEQTNQKLDDLNETIKDRLPMNGINDLNKTLKNGVPLAVFNSTSGGG